MLQHFTWQQFLVAALILSFIWYAVIVLLFCGKQIKEFFSGKNKLDKPAEPLSHFWDEDLDEEFSTDEEDLMGKSALPEGMSRLSMAQFGFAPEPNEVPIRQDENKAMGQKADTGNDPAGDYKETHLGPIPDVLEELKRIFHTLEIQQGSKDDFVSLFKLVSSKYPKIKGTLGQQMLNEHIRDHVLFPISDEELDNLWN